ncbi:MAG: hypothetical protein ABMA64_33110 [Myxococcota bacterium]
MSNWNVRQLHRWLSVAFTLAVLANFGAMTLPTYPMWVGYAALLPLWLLLFTGLWLFVQPYVIRWRRAPG